MENFCSGIALQKRNQAPGKMRPKPGLFRFAQNRNRGLIGVRPIIPRTQLSALGHAQNPDGCERSVWHYEQRK